MRKLFDRLFNYRLRALIKKEFAQTRHDRKLMFTLTVLPVVQLTLVGFALSCGGNERSLSPSSTIAGRPRAGS